MDRHSWPEHCNVGKPKWEFPQKLGVPLWGLNNKDCIVFWGLYWGSLILGNYQMITWISIRFMQGLQGLVAQTIG